MRKTEDKHLFAVFVGNLFVHQKPRANVVTTLTDQDVVHRIVTVLRMQIGEELQLFDDHDYYLAKIIDIKKNKVITLQIISVSANPKPKLEINFLLPLLKKEALEETIYSLTEIGVSSIQLLITDKSQKNLSDKDVARLKKIQIAAAEQSKNFNIPVIAAPMTLERFCSENKLNGIPALLFDPEGKLILELLTEIQQKKISKVFCAIGPEGGLTTAEIQLLMQYGFRMCKLTSTTLRALQAAAVGAGLLASIL